MRLSDEVAALRSGGGVATATDATMDSLLRELETLRVQNADHQSVNNSYMNLQDEMDALQTRTSALHRDNATLTDRLKSTETDLAVAREEVRLQ